MLRTTTVTAAISLGVALLAPTTAASATSETCDGRPATIVGSADATVRGTANDDVVVTNGASFVDTGDGDDVVCLTVPTDHPYATSAAITAGAGDDVVLIEGEGTSSTTDLGPGRDLFHGGDGDDSVRAGLDDTVVADRGGDLVTYTLAREELLPDVVGTLTARRTDGWIKVVAPGRRLVMDGRKGVVRLDGRVVTTFRVPPRMLFGVAQRVTLLGTPGVDRLAGAACGKSVLRGRGGDDELVTYLDRETPREECPRRTVSAFGGTGDDDLLGTAYDDVLRGGPGRDDIRGQGGADVLLGGPGRDRADGGKGRDRCGAERERRCER
jgi:Ca2+-binding RTX toxin-like protein